MLPSLTSSTGHSARQVQDFWPHCAASQLAKDRKVHFDMYCLGSQGRSSIEKRGRDDPESVKFVKFSFILLCALFALPAMAFLCNWPYIVLLYTTYNCTAGLNFKYNVHRQLDACLQ